MINIERMCVKQGLFVILISQLFGPCWSLDNTLAPYEEVPSSQKAVLHDPALLRCVAATQVERCRWTWRPLSSLVTPFVVREFEAFGPSSRDCSVRFRTLLAEHEGEWTCATLARGATEYIEAPPAFIRIAHDEGIQFSERPEPTEVQAGEAAVLRCVVQQDTQVDWCRWTWRPLKHLNAPRVPVKEFLPFGNESRDCSVRFRAAQPEQSGEWSCGVRPRGQLNFQSTQPADLIVLRREMQFVQLSQDLQVAAGETVLLRCVTADRVHRCRWLWRPFDSSDNAIEVKNFAAFGNSSRDCSVRFSSVLPEQAGEWTCGVQPEIGASFQDAPPARLNLLPAVKVRFVDVAEDSRVASGTSLKLACSVTARVSLCRWTWKPLETVNEEPLYPIEFKGKGNWSRDCSLTINDVQKAHEGLWTCSVIGPPGIDTTYSASPVKIIVYHPVKVEFSELTRSIQMPDGSPVLLRCITTQRVQRCRWTHRTSSESEMSSDELREFSPIGDDGTDCSVRLSSVTQQQSGEWTCSVQAVGEDDFQDAPSVRLTVLPQGNVMTPSAKVQMVHVSDWPVLEPLVEPSWNLEGSEVTVLVCLSNQPFTSCHWLGPQGAIISVHQDRLLQAGRLWSGHVDEDRGFCTLGSATRLEPQIAASWSCFLTFETNEGVEIQFETHLDVNTSKLKTSSSILVLLVMLLIGLVLLLSIFFSLLKVIIYKQKDKSLPIQNIPYKINKKKVRFLFPDDQEI